MLFDVATFVTSLQDWANKTYPPWAHGPGYVISLDIALFVVKGHQKDFLKVNATPSSSCRVERSFQKFLS